MSTVSVTVLSIELQYISLSLWESADIDCLLWRDNYMLKIKEMQSGRRTVFTFIIFLK